MSFRLDPFELLGKNLNDSESKIALETLGKPRVNNHRRLRTLNFDQYGFSLDYEIKDEVICGVSYHFASRSVIDGAVARFKGLLPLGIQCDDSREVVRSKIGVKPYRSSGSEVDGDSWDRYELNSLRFHFYFNSITGRIAFLGVADPKFYQLS